MHDEDEDERLRRLTADPSAVLKALMFAARCRKERDDARGRAAGLSEEVARLRVQVAALSDQLHRSMASGIGGGSGRPSMAAPLNDSTGSAGSSAAYGWSASTDDDGRRWSYRDHNDGSKNAVPIDAEYLMRDAGVSDAHRAVMARGGEGAQFAVALLRRVARAERKRNAELEERKEQLHALVDRNTRRHCEAECVDRLREFERSHAAVVKKHLQAIAEVVRESTQAVRRDAVEGQRQRAAAAEREAAAAVATRHHYGGAPPVATDVSRQSLMVEDSTAALVQSPLPPTTQHAAARRPPAAAAPPTRRTLVDDASTLPSLGRGASAADTSLPDVRTATANSTLADVTYHQQHQRTLLDGEVQAVSPVQRANATTMAREQDDGSVAKLLQVLETTRRETSTAELDVSAAVARYQLQELQRLHDASSVHHQSHLNNSGRDHLPRSSSAAR